MNVRLILLWLLLTLCAGFVDATAFFGLGVFTANMTGNTVLLGGALAAHALGRPFPGLIGIFPALLSIAAFAAGALVAATVLRGETGRPPVRTIALVLLVAALLAAAALLQRAAGAAPLNLCVALLSAAMGLQSVVAVRAGVPGVSTTFVTGTLVTAIVKLGGQTPETPALRKGGEINVAVWACYLAGALSGAFGLRLLGAQALWVPAVVVALLAAMV